MAIFYIDFVNGNDANAGTSWGLAWRSATSGATAARISPGDIIKVAKSPDTTSLGQSALWTNLSRAVVLTTAVTANIDLCETAWTASTNVVCTANSYRKEGSFSSQHQIGSLFTTGKVSYRTLTSIDLSGYQQVSFWVQSSVFVASGSLTLNLCSDTLGDVAINTIPIPTCSNFFHVVTVNLGANLGSVIQSVALYALTDFGAATITIDNIIACKAKSSPDSLTLSSLISKNSLSQGGAEGFYGIKSINGVNIQLDTNCASQSLNGQGYSGATQTVATHKRDPLVLAGVSGVSDFRITDSGTASSLIEYQGGFNTSTNIQDGETYMDGINGNVQGIEILGVSFNLINYLNPCRYYQGLRLSAAKNIVIQNISSCNNFEGININVSNFNKFINIGNINNNQNAALYINNSFWNKIDYIGGANNISSTSITITNQSGNNVLKNINTINNNSSQGIYLNDSQDNTFNSINAINNNTSYGIYTNNCPKNYFGNLLQVNNNGYAVVSAASKTNIKNITTAGSTNATSLYVTNADIFIGKGSVSEATVVLTAVSGGNNRICIDNFNNTGNASVYTDGGRVITQTSTMINGSGKEWKLSTIELTNFNRTASSPLSLSIGKFYVNANALVTVKVFMKKGNASSIGGQLICRGGQLDGVTNDVIANKANDLNEEELTIAFTPTEAGVIEIEVQAYYISGHSFIIVDKLTITQA